jgi:hypothetical protein
MRCESGTFEINRAHYMQPTKNPRTILIDKAETYTSRTQRQ